MAKFPQDAVRRLLGAYSFKGITSYGQLTFEEKELVTEAEFQEIVAWLRPPPEPPTALDIAKTALVTITEKHGRVCGEFELCKHIACNDSHAAWEIADEALSKMLLIEQPDAYCHTQPDGTCDSVDPRCPHSLVGKEKK